MNKVMNRRNSGTEKSTKRSSWSRKKQQVEWFANGFDPIREKQNQDFAKAIKQTAPIFDVRRLDNQHYSTMNGVDALAISALSSGELGHSSQQKQAKLSLLEDWREILQDQDDDFHVIGMRITSAEADIWVYHAESWTLFMLRFSGSGASDDWLSRRIYRFPNEQ